MRQTWEIIVDLWDTGNFWIRLAVAFVLGWPVILAALILAGVRGDAAMALALIPGGALVLLFLVIPPMLPVLLVVLPAPWISRDQREAAAKGALRFLTLLAATELVVGVYLAGVPIWNDPGLLLWLAAAAAIFSTLWLGGYRRPWFRKVFVAAVLVITALFFLGGREELRQAVIQETQAEAVVPLAQVPSRPPIGTVEEFTVKKDEEVDTVATWQGSQHRVTADNEWLLISAVPEGTPCGRMGQRRPDGLCEFRMSAGRRSIIGTSAEGPARVKGVADGTTIRFERIG